MKLKTATLAGTLSLCLTAAYAQSPGNGAGATAGGSSASGGQAASSTTTGSSLNGSICNTFRRPASICSTIHGQATTMTATASKTGGILIVGSAFNDFVRCSEPLAT